MKDEYNPLSRGIIQNSVGHIPAGPRNPEIYYTQDGHATAAITLLTFLLMKKEVVEHLNVSQVSILAAHRYDELSRQISANLRQKFPAGTMGNSLKINENSREIALGLASLTDNVLEIFYNSGRGHAKQGAQMMKAAFELFASDPDLADVDIDDVPLIEEVDDDLVAEEDASYAHLPQPLGEIIDIHHVLDAANDPKKLAELMQKVQTLPDTSPLKIIPKTVCHEVGHLHPIRDNMILNGLYTMPGDVIPNYNPKDYAVRDGEDVPPTLQPYFINKAVKYSYQKDVFDPEWAAAKLVAPDRISYYFTKTMEAEAELIGTALLDDIEAQHGVKMYQTNIKDYMPRVYSLYQKCIGIMESPEPLDNDIDYSFAIPDDEEPDAAPHMTDFAAFQAKKTYELK